MKYPTWLEEKLVPIKECPFCGEKAQLYAYPEISDLAFVQCSNPDCGCQSPPISISSDPNGWWTNKEHKQLIENALKAIRIWNKRNEKNQ